MEKSKALVLVPTYNERENVEELCNRLLALDLDIDVLFIDDNSPDGTGEIVDALAKRHRNVLAGHRPGKLGIGSAHREGIRWAYQQGYSDLVTMDCDFTHPPCFIPEIMRLGNQTNSDVVVGSRYLQEKSLAGWNPFRLVLTHAGHFLTKTLLGMPQDATGGFRYYRLNRIPEDIFEPVTSRGYSFFFESLYILFLNGFRIGELPIPLPPRTRGDSKMNLSEILHSLRLFFSLYLNTVVNRDKFLLKGGYRPTK